MWISSPHPAREISSIEARRELLNSARPVLRVAWESASDPTGAKASGDIIWDSQQQVGYMRFVGLAPNDPSKEQYQLWIFDAERDERYPVDGGVFDIGRNGEVVVRIKAAVHVTKPVLFAVTVEKPG